jgi:hypothetical protein
MIIKFVVASTAKVEAGALYHEPDRHYFQTQWDICNQKHRFIATMPPQ